MSKGGWGEGKVKARGVLGIPGGRLSLLRRQWALSNLYNQNFRKFGNSGKCYRHFPEKFPEVLETVEFPKCEPFNQKF